MAPKQVSIEAYSADTVDFIQCLDRHEVRFMIVGGEAVIFHGYPRFTEDIDFFFSTAPENLKALMAALDEFWEGDVPVVKHAEDLAEIGYVLQFGRKPNRIDLLNQIDGIDFADAWESKVDVILEDQGEVKAKVAFIGKQALIRNKVASGRLKDQLDAEYLSKQDEEA